MPASDLVDAPVAAAGSEDLTLEGYAEVLAHLRHFPGHQDEVLARLRHEEIAWRRAEAAWVAAMVQELAAERLVLIERFSQRFATVRARLRRDMPPLSSIGDLTPSVRPEQPASNMAGSREPEATARPLALPSQESRAGALPSYLRTGPAAENPPESASRGPGALGSRVFDVADAASATMAVRVVDPGGVLPFEARSSAEFQSGLNASRQLRLPPSRRADGDETAAVPILRDLSAKLPFGRPRVPQQPGVDVTGEVRVLADPPLPFAVERAPVGDAASVADRASSPSVSGDETVAVPHLRTSAQALADLPFGGAVGGGHLTLEQFASFRAELSVYPEHRVAIFRRYGLEDDAVRLRTEQHWAARLQQDVTQRVRFAELCDNFRLHLLRGRSR